MMARRSSCRLLALAAGKDERLAGDPTRVVRCEKYSDSGDVFGLGDAAEWRLGFNFFAEVAFGEANGMEPFCFRPSMARSVSRPRSFR